MIDYIVMSEKGNEKMEIMESLESDHMKIIVNMDEEKEKEEEENVEEYTVWGEKEIEKYRDGIKGLGKEKEWRKIKEIISKALQKRRREQRKEIKEKWWDEECKRKRNKVIEMVRRAKKGETSIE